MFLRANCAYLVLFPTYMYSQIMFENSDFFIPHRLAWGYQVIKKFDDSYVYPFAMQYTSVTDALHRQGDAGGQNGHSAY